MATQYESGGAIAISCLTDQSFFGAKADDLPQARTATTLPVLRKDFIIDERQILEANAMGADAILLIARVLTRDELARLIREATSMRIAALVEVHDEEDVLKSVDAGAQIIGVNNRNLATFDVSLDTALRLRDCIPDTCVKVAESGIYTAEDVGKMADAGYDAVLVGESLVCSPDPEAAVGQLLRTQRTEAAP